MFALPPQGQIIACLKPLHNVDFTRKGPFLSDVHIRYWLFLEKIAIFAL